MRHTRKSAKPRDERGASAVEYGLLLALVTSIIFATVVALGLSLLPGLQALIAAWP